MVKEGGNNSTGALWQVRVCYSFVQGWMVIVAAKMSL